MQGQSGWLRTPAPRSGHHPTTWVTGPKQKQPGVYASRQHQQGSPAWSIQATFAGGMRLCRNLQRCPVSCEAEAIARPLLPSFGVSVNRRAFEPHLDGVPMVNVANNPTRFKHNPRLGLRRVGRPASGDFYTINKDKDVLAITVKLTNRLAAHDSPYLGLIWRSRCPKWYHRF
jgi:hypothetical protein